MPCVVNATAGAVEKRPLDMDPQNPGNTGFDCRLDRRDGARDAIEIVADQGRQKAGRAETPVGCADRPDRCDGGRVIE